MKASEVVTLTNQVRAEHGLAPLVVNQDLVNTAAIRAEELCTTGNLSHDGWKEVVTPRYSYVRVGENLAKNYDTSTKAVDAWVDSPKHFDNLVGNYSETGVAVKECGANTYTVQHFGTPDVGLGSVITIIITILCIVIGATIWATLRKQ